MNEKKNLSILVTEPEQFNYSINLEGAGELCGNNTSMYAINSWLHSQSAVATFSPLSLHHRWSNNQNVSRHLQCKVACVGRKLCKSMCGCISQRNEGNMIPFGTRIKRLLGPPRCPSVNQAWIKPEYGGAISSKLLLTALHINDGIWIHASLEYHCQPDGEVVFL